MIKDFEYFAPQKLDKALALLEKYEDSKVIAGGQSLLIIMKQGLVAPEYVIDIKGLTELDYIKSGRDGKLRIGALTTHHSIEYSPLMIGPLSVLAQMEKRLASPQTRNWGTIGGNIAHGDPAGDPAPVLMSLDARIKLSKVGHERFVPISEFYRDYFESVMEHNELITEIEIPKQPARTGTAYTKFNQIDSEMATVGTAVAITLSANGMCGEVRIALGAVAPTPIRAKQAEAVLKGKKPTEALFEKAGIVAAGETEPILDINATAEFRREIVKVLVKRVCAEACSRAKEA